MKSTKFSFVYLSLLAVSPFAMGQSYNGTVGDLNTIFDPPMNIQGTLCDSTVNTGNEHAYKACTDGVAASRWMAEKYAKNTGKYLGCLDGFYQGVYDGYQGAINPTADMSAEAAAYVKGAKFETASSRGLERAKAEGQTESADQIIGRYRAVIGLKDSQGRQVLPDKGYNYPKVTFTGFDDGYEFDILKQSNKDFEAVYQTGWVTERSSFEDRLAARRALALQKEYANNLCNQNDTIFGRRNMPVVTIWDYFRARRQQDFKDYGWRNPDWAWEIFDRDERSLEQYLTFKRLESLEKTVSQIINITEQRLKLDASGNPIRKLKADGTPMLDAQGRPVFEMEEIITGTRLETKRVPLTSGEIQELKNIYINGFKLAYDRYYARQYASQNYVSEGADKYKVARIIGAAIGKDVAEHTAKRVAYNTQYKAQSASKFAEEVKRLYKQSFDRLIGIFENNPVLELNDAEVVGMTNDSIYRPGEELRVQFAVTNLGEAARASSLTLDNSIDVITNRGGFSFTAPILARTNYTTNVIGQISNDKFARETIQVAMGIRNPGDLEEVAKPLIVRKGKTITLNDYAEIDNVKSELDYLAGELNILVDLKNPASIESPTIAIVEAKISGDGTVEKNVEPIAAKSSRSVSLNVTNMDPLAIIINRRIDGVVNAKIMNKTVHRTTFSRDLNVDGKTALSAYFDALAVKKTSNTGKESRADRVAKLEGMLESYLKDDIAENTLWKNEAEMGRTIVRSIQKAYDESKRAGRLNADAQKIYDSLAQVLARNTKFLKAGGFLRSKKANQENFLEQIAKISKISVKVKDWDK